MRILLISGSLRSHSTNTAVLRTALATAPAGADLRLYTGMAELPHFNPDDDIEGAPPAPVARLRAEIGAAGAVVFSTPEYAGALPGSFKNLLEWTVGGAEMYGKPVAWFNVAGVAAPTGGSAAHESLRTVLDYIGAEIVEAACARLPLARSAVNAEGAVDDPAIRTGVGRAIEALIAHVGRMITPG